MTSNNHTLSIKPDIMDKAMALDSQDTLAPYKDKFHLPNGVIYLDGNSLGVLPKTVKDRVVHTIENEWGNGLIRSWNDAGWVDAPTRIGDKLATVLGANAGEIIITDTISINLFKIIPYALNLTDKKTILVEKGTFPSDIYITEGVATLSQGVTVKHIPADDHDIITHLSDDIGVAVLSDVNFKTGRRLDMTAITQYAKSKGIYIIWDLAHSAGAVDLDLKASGVEFAVGCTYKYLNGGPGAPAFVYVDKSLQGKTTQPITGWFSHRDMFAMSPDYEPMDTIEQFQVGSFSALTYHALEESINIWQDVDMKILRQKSLQLTDFFLECMQDCIKDNNWQLITPTDHHERGSHISFAVDNGYAIVQALIARGVIGDFRKPDVIRFGFTPLYLSHVDIATAAAHFDAVMQNQEYQDPKFNVMGKVT